MKIEAATPADWQEIYAIYRDGILTNDATFNTVEDIPASGEAWFAGKLLGYVLKAVDEDGRMLGWGSLSPTSSRRVYRGVVESSIYVAADAGGRGVGQALLNRLVALSEEDDIWTIVASIFPENEASIHIHAKAGFRIVGRRERIAQQNGRWRDVIWMERRSNLV